MDTKIRNLCLKYVLLLYTKTSIFIFLYNIFITFTILTDFLKFMALFWHFKDDNHLQRCYCQEKVSIQI